MSQPMLFALSVTLYSLPVVVCAVRRTTFSFVLLYAHLAALFVIAGVLGATFRLEVLGVPVLAGQVAYGGLVLTAVVLTVLGREAQVLRNIIAASALVAVVFALSNRLALAALGTAGTGSLLDVRDAPFAPGLRGEVAGPVMFLGELLLLLAVLETAKRRLSPGAMVPVYVLGFVGVLVLDGVLFPLLVLTPVPDLGALVVAGVQAKLVLAAAYAVPLLASVLINRRAFDSFADTPVPLRDLLSLSASTDAVLAMLQRSTRREDEVRATVSGLLGAPTSTVLLLTDDRLRVTEANPGTAALLGTGRDELVGVAVGSFLDVEPTTWGTTADGQHRAVGFRRPDGGSGTLSVSLSEVTSDGDRLGFLVCGEDVTERVRAERAAREALEAEQQAVARLVEADRVKDDVVSTVSHELRTPLTTMVGWIEVLDGEELGPLLPEQRAALDTVARNTERLQHLVEDLLRVARGESELRLGPTDLGRLVSTSLAELGRSPSARDRTLEVRVPATPVLVQADTLAIERVLLNLVGNALKFTPPRGRVTVLLRRLGDAAEVVVTDTGRGISAEDLPHVFDRFWRAPDAREQQVPGSGLGLHVAREIADAHRGSLTLASELGAGTTATLRMPLLAD